MKSLASPKNFLEYSDDPGATVCAVKLREFPFPLGGLETLI